MVDEDEDFFDEHDDASGHGWGGESTSLVGTESEQAPGVGDSSHPAPASMVVDGLPRVHGEVPSTAAWVAPTDATEQSGGDVDAEAAAALGRVQDSAENQQDTERPDLGTP